MSVLIRITDDNRVIVEQAGTVKCSKEISYKNLVKAVTLLSHSAVGIEEATPILPKGCIHYCRYTSGKEYFILEYDERHSDFLFYGTTYSNVGIPKLLFFVEVLNKKIVGTKVVAVKDHFVLPDTELFRWPFTNVYSHDFSICWGSVILPDINEQYEISALPRVFLNQENTLHLYMGSNKSGKEFREILGQLQGKDFDDDILLSTGFKLEYFLKIKEENEND